MGFPSSPDTLLTAPLVLPAESGKPLTTQGGSTLDDGNGSVSIKSTLDVQGVLNAHSDFYANTLYSFSDPIIATGRLGLQSAATLNSGTGAPTIAGTAGDFYFRTDTPTTADQRIYVCTVSGAAGAATWVGIV